MKKLLYLTLSIIFIFLLCACQDNKTNHELIELQSSELLNYLMDNENKNIIFALYYEDKTNSESFMDSLTKVVNNINNNVYYINMNHLDTNSIFNIFDYLEGNYLANSYVVYENNEAKLANEYVDFKTIIKDLKAIHIKEDEIPKIDEQTKLEALEKARNLYSEGYISESLSYLNKAWDLKEAKDEFKNKRNYLVVNCWEAYHMLDSTTQEAEYIAIDIYEAYQDFYLYQTKGKLTEIEKPNMIDYERNIYKIENDIIYLKKEEKSNKYQEKYRIMDISNESLQLQDINTKTIYNFVRRG